MNTKQPSESFRDSLSTINEKGKRVWVYPKLMTGKLYNLRHWLAYIFLIWFIVLPFIQVHGHPFFLLDVIHRRFIIFGLVFWPQDFFLFGLGMLTFFVFIILFTAVFGRVWCGWACPQTIFMEMVFRKIEYWIEGDSQQQRILDKQEWNSEKIIKKFSKHLIFYVLSFLISNLFLAYIVGINQLEKIITEPITEHFGGFVSMLVFSGVFYLVFAKMREQICLVVCPYGRLQGVLLDKDSTVVAYDFKRGEPRGKINTTKGDCIDCHLCVQVCPTGIDIRNGTQLECINCAACIDACNSIMTKVNKPKGLIRYASLKNILLKAPFTITARMIAYSLILLLLMSAESVMMINRSDIETTVMRSPGLVYQRQSDNRISNLYTINLVNKTFDPQEISLKLLSPSGTLDMIGGTYKIDAEGSTDGAFIIYLNADSIHHNKNTVKIQVINNQKVIDIDETVFVGPVKFSDSETDVKSDTITSQTSSHEKK